MAEELAGPVAVIAGGLSHERDISLASGRNLVRELRRLGVEAHAYDFDRNLLHTLERLDPQLPAPEVGIEQITVV